MKNRIFSVLLALTLTLAMVPQNVYAADPASVPIVIEETGEETENEENTEVTEESADTTDVTLPEESVETPDQEDQEDREEIASPEEPAAPEEETPEPETDFVMPPDGYHEVEEVSIESVYDYPEGTVAPMRGTLESYYVTDALPDLRNQGNYGTCWAHAAMALAEINLMKQGKLTVQELSELHLAYFSYNEVQDPLGGLDGDVNGAATDESLFNRGGNLSLAQNVLSAWTGAADERTLPYSQAQNYNARGSVSPSLSFDDVAHLTGYYEAPIDVNDLSPVKRLIKDYGAVGISFCTKDNFNGTVDSSVYNAEYNSFYGPNERDSNHAVVIVGWDDDFPAEHFNNTAPGNGAWLVRNSWTTGDFESGQEFKGYFWMSYYEASLDEPARAYVFDTAENYQHNYQYDGGMKTWTISGYDKYANIFTAHAEGAVDGEIIKAASFYTSTANASYTVEIYTDLEDVGDPLSGTLRCTEVGATTYPGYYTVELENTVPVDANEKFAVVVSLSKNGDVPTMGYECPVSNTWFTSTTTALPGQSLVYKNSKWTDYGANNNRNLRIKAFTDDADLLNPIVAESISFGDEIDQNGLTLGIGETYQLQPVFTPANATSKKLTWSSSDDTIATVTNGKLKGVSAGTATITATAELGEAYREIEVTVSADKLVSISIGYSTKLDNQGRIAIHKGKTCQFSVIPNPADLELSDVEWTSSNEDILTINENGLGRAISTGPVTVTARVGGKEATADVRVYLGPPEAEIYVNDDNSVTVSWRHIDGATSYRLELWGQVNDTQLQQMGETIEIPIVEGKNIYTKVLDYYVDKNVAEETQIKVKATTVQNTASNTISYSPYYVGPTYTVTYHPGNGTNPEANPATYKYCRYTSPFKLLNAEPPTGYSFAGWYEDESFTTRRAYISWSDTGDMDLYAKYNPNQYQVRYYYNDGTTGYNTGAYYYDRQATLRTSSKYRSGYTLTGWNTEPDGSGTPYELGQSILNLCTGNGDILNLYAQWEPADVSVSLNCGGGNIDGDSSATVTKKYGRPYGELPVPVRTGYTFAGWYTSSGTSGTLVDEDTIVTSYNTNYLYAHWNAISYTITLDTMGGELEDGVDDTITRSYGGIYGVIPTPVRAGYTFNGWRLGSSSGTRIYESTTVNTASDHTLYAAWTGKSITVFFDTNGSQNTVSSYIVTVGETYGTCVDRSVLRDGYIFAGWYTEAEGGTRITSGTVVERTAAHTVYAHWVPRTYIVTLDANGGTINGQTSTEKYVAYTGTYGELPVPVREGYVFKGWFTDPSGGTEVKADSVMNSAAPSTLYAHWGGATYNLIMDAAGGTIEGEPTATKEIENGAKYGTLPLPVRSGYTFQGWYTAATGGSTVSGTAVVNTTSDITIYAHWTAKTYTVTYDPNGGTVTGTKKNVTFGQAYGALPVPTRPGFTFVAWTLSDDPETVITANTVVSVASNHTIKAKWVTERYSLIFDVNGGDSVTETSREVEYGSAYGELPTAAKTGYDFAGWYTSAAGGERITAETVYSAFNAVTVYARYTPKQYTLTLDANGGTVDGASTSTAEVTFDSPYGNLPNAEKDGYEFAGWYTAANGGTEVTADTLATTASAHTVYAHYVAKEYTVTFDRNGGNLALADRTKKVTYDSAYGTLPVPTRINMDFTGWYTQQIGGTKVEADTMVTTASDHTLYAHWREKTGWIQSGRKTYYVLENGERATGATEIDGHSYYFDESTGKMMTGWVTVAGKQYYYSPSNGAMMTGKVTIGRKEYYLDSITGEMKTGWQTINGEEYYFDPEKGSMLTGWITVDDKTYYLDENGVKASGRTEIDEEVYFLNEVTGETQTGVIVYEGDEYILNEEGAALTGWVEFDDGTESYADPETGKVIKAAMITDGDDIYYLDDEGQRITGWKDEAGKRYFFDEDGIASTGWKTIDGAVYYFDEAGAAAIDMTVIDKKLYFFDTTDGDDKYKLVSSGNVLEFTPGEDGVLYAEESHFIELAGGTYFINKKGEAVTGWVERDGSKYYMDKKTGAAATGAKRIGVKIYYFEADGRLADSSVTPTVTLPSGNGTQEYIVREDGSLKTGWTRNAGFVPVPNLGSTLQQNGMQSETASSPEDTAQSTSAGTAQPTGVEKPDIIAQPTGTSHVTSTAQAACDTQTAVSSQPAGVAETTDDVQNADSTASGSQTAESVNSGTGGSEYHSAAVISDAEGIVAKSENDKKSYVALVMAMAAAALLALALMHRKKS